MDSGRFCLYAVELHMNFQSAKEYILKRLAAELSPKLYYHGLHHTIDVYNSAKQLAAEELLSGEELLLLETAVLFHDAGFIEQYQHNEPVGVKIAKEALPQFGYNPGQIETIANIIMATARQEQPQTLSEKIMCDADLDYLGSSNFNTIAASLRKELDAYGITYTDYNWDEMQLSFLEKHTYYTDAAIRKNAAAKKVHIEEIKSRINRI